MNSNQQRQRRHQQWRNWHLWSGVLSVVVLLNLAVTGIALNHTDDLSLSSRYLGSNWLLRWYGFKAPGQVQSVTFDSGQALQLDDQLLIDKRQIGEGFSDLAAVCVSDDVLVVTTQSEVVLSTLQGELIERLGLPPSLVAQLERVGCELAGPVAQVGGQFYRPDALYSNWNLIDQQTVDQAKIAWSEVEQLGSLERKKVYQLYHQRSLSWERLLLDLHSGRLFGWPGLLLVDICGLLLILQLISGIYLFLKRNG
ncbi:MAG: PepSY domain-containing protein [Immundisolibacteraceae bacterium]|nr:PepSY domain-containing protein [Immundisolibacteraceae bacterium]